jgi:hypothetical protein
MVDRVENTPFPPLVSDKWLETCKNEDNFFPLNIIVHVFELKDNKVFSLKK